MYEAGPCGYSLLRRLRDGLWPCELVAPTVIPKKPGDRVKEYRRAAQALAWLSAAGYLEPLLVPAPVQEALRILNRDRLDAKDHIQRRRQRVQQFLLRHERRYESSNWTAKHPSWLSDLKFVESADQISLRTKIDIMVDLERRLAELECDIEHEPQARPWLPVVASLRALRGVDRLMAITLMAEFGDLRLFPITRQFMAYLGLTPASTAVVKNGRRRRLRRRVRVSYDAC